MIATVSPEAIILLSLFLSLDLDHDTAPTTDQDLRTTSGIVNREETDRVIGESIYDAHAGYNAQLLYAVHDTDGVQLPATANVLSEAQAARVAQGEAFLLYAEDQLLSEGQNTDGLRFNYDVKENEEIKLVYTNPVIHGGQQVNDDQTYVAANGGVGQQLYGLHIVPDDRPVSEVQQGRVVVDSQGTVYRQVPTGEDVSRYANRGESRSPAIKADDDKQERHQSHLFPFYVVHHGQEL